MNTDDLIRALGRDVPAIRRGALRRRILAGVVGGGLVSLLLIALGLGFRPDLWIAMHGFPFWMKWGYTASLGLVAILATFRLARPDPVPLRLLWLLAAPVLLLAGLCIGELAHKPVRDWLAMCLGGSWKVCPWLVVTLSVPIFVGLLWSFRRLAPTRLRATGAAAGLAAGASAATLYCLHCGEVSPLFVLTWYSLGILLAAGLGALAGPRLLRW